MTSIASSSISSRSTGPGQRAPVTCSFSSSPVPTPRKKRPSIITCEVAAAWAMIAGWMRMVGQVTPVPSRSCSVACGDAADHAPDERALALRVDPRVVVVGDQREGEAGLFGQARVADQVVGRCSSEESA